MGRNPYGRQTAGYPPCLLVLFLTGSKQQSAASTMKTHTRARFLKQRHGRGTEKYNNHFSLCVVELAGQISDGVLVHKPEALQGAKVMTAVTLELELLYVLLRQTCSLSQSHMRVGHSSAAHARILPRCDSTFANGHVRERIVLAVIGAWRRRRLVCG